MGNPTKEEILGDAAKYESRGQWKRGSERMYRAALRLGFHEEACAHMTKGNKYWSLEDLQEDAKKYSTRVEWQRNSSSAYSIARTRKVLELCCGHMIELVKPVGYWTEENLAEEALKFASKSEWSANSSGSYTIAQRLGIVDKLCAHMEVIYKRWTIESVKEDARKYSSRTQWARSSSSYAWAQKIGAIDECSEHMGDRVTSSFDAIYIWKATRWAYNGKPVFKIGMTSSRLGDIRIHQVAKAAEADAEIVILMKVPRANVLEMALLKLGDDPKYVDFDGCTEFRALDEDQLQVALSMIAEHAHKEASA